MKSQLKCGDLVCMRYGTKKSHTWLRIGRIRSIENNKAIVYWYNYYGKQSALIDLGQLVKYINKRYR